jgi:hypothetical protein
LKRQLALQRTVKKSLERECLTRYFQRRMVYNARRFLHQRRQKLGRHNQTQDFNLLISIIRRGERVDEHVVQQQKGW